MLTWWHHAVPCNAERLELLYSSEGRAYHIRQIRVFVDGVYGGCACMHVRLCMVGAEVLGMHCACMPAGAIVVCVDFNTLHTVRRCWDIVALYGPVGLLRPYPTRRIRRA